jgi:hypothetical protein
MKKVETIEDYVILKWLSNRIKRDVCQTVN